ncbi:MAG: hypothetical protein ACRD3W_23860 [Terriglobales bacterium]
MSTVDDGSPRSSLRQISAAPRVIDVGRPWITVAAHRVFGITAAGVYKRCSPRQYVGAHGAVNGR